MFKKSFAKYARAVGSENERKGLFRLFCAKRISEAVFLALCVAVIAEALLFSDDFAAEEIGAALALFGITLLLWIAAAIVAFVLWLVFRSSYKNILARPARAEEMPEIASYREKMREDGARTKKSTRLGVGLLTAGLVFMFAAFAVDIIKNPETDGLTFISYIGIGVFCVCLFALFMILFFTEYIKVINGKTAEMQTAEESKAIDAAQGRAHGYSLQEDKNAQTYRYLFPDEALCAKAEELQKKQAIVTMVATVVSCFLGIAAVVVFFTPLVFGRNLTGYAFPVFLTAVTVIVYAASLPCSVRMVALEKQQRAELEQNPAYAKNFAVYRKYQQFAKVKGKILIISLALAILVGFALAIIFPDAAWSLLSVLLPIAGLVLNNKFVSGLRKEVRPLEEEIDLARSAADNASQTAADQNGEDA